jgi:hypothetical protein
MRLLIGGATRRRDERLHDNEGIYFEMRGLRDRSRERPPRTVGGRQCSRVQCLATVRHFLGFLLFPKLRVAGSNPVSRSKNPMRPRLVAAGAFAHSGSTSTTGAV